MKRLTMLVLLFMSKAAFASIDVACTDADGSNDFAVIPYGGLVVVFERCPPPPPSNFRMEGLRLRTGSMDGTYELAWDNLVSERIDYQEIEEVSPGGSQTIYGVQEGLQADDERFYFPDPSPVNGSYTYRIRSCSNLGCKESDNLTFRVPRPYKIPGQVANVPVVIGKSGVVVSMEFDLDVGFTGADLASALASVKQDSLYGMESKWSRSVGPYVTSVTATEVPSNAPRHIRIDINNTHHPSAAIGDLTIKMPINLPIGVTGDYPDVVAHELGHILIGASHRPGTPNCPPPWQNTIMCNAGDVTIGDIEDVLENYEFLVY